MCGGGGGGGSGTQKYEWNDVLGPYWQWQIGQGQDLATKPYTPYPYEQIAPMNADQQQAISSIRNFVNSGGSQATQAARDQLIGTLGGDYLSGSQANPYAGSQNAYMGDNPYFRNTLQSGLQDITNAYMQGTSPETTRLFNLSGAFGGSAHKDAIANNENALAKQLGNYTNQMQSGQYDRSANLYENMLNRGSGAYEAERGRQLGAIGGGQADQGIQLQGANALLGVGDAERAYTQDLYNNYYNNWQKQQQYPMTMADWFSGLLGRAQGGVSPNVTTQTSGYQASPFSQILGAGLLGSAFFGGK